MRVDDTKNYKRDNPVSMTRRIQNTENNVEGIDIMQISGHNNVAFINNYSTLSEERHKKISNILSNTESETNRNAFQQTYLVKPPQILQPVALLMFRVEAIPMFLFTVPIQICQVKLVLCFTRGHP